MVPGRPQVIGLEALPNEVGLEMTSVPAMALVLPNQPDPLADLQIQVNLPTDLLTQAVPGLVGLQSSALISETEGLQTLERQKAITETGFIYLPFIMKQPHKPIIKVLEPNRDNKLVDPDRNVEITFAAYAVQTTLTITYQ